MSSRVVAGSELAYVLVDGQAYFAWMRIEEYVSAKGPHRDMVFADATTGRQLTRHPKIYYARSLVTYDCHNSVIENACTDVVSSSSNTISTGDDAIDSAHNFAIATYDYYFDNFGRDSLNDGGMTLYSNVHFDVNYNNAFWYNGEMTYGDGDGVTFVPLSQDADVVAHELTHGVTENTSDLVYEKESGALNESLSDIFGALVDRQEGASSADTWKLGEDIYTPGTPGDALRYMADPTQDGYSTDYYPNRLYQGNCNPSNSNDQCGVHGNSGISNLAFVVLVDGGTHPQGETSNSVPAQGFDTAAKIFYEANVNCLTSSSDFEAMRNCTAEKAALHFGTTEEDAVHEAWDAVGVPGGPVPDDCGNGTCDAGEDFDSCPEDCDEGGTCGECGNGICEAGDGEDCNNCPDDCRVVGSYCCGEGGSCPHNACSAGSLDCTEESSGGDCGGECTPTGAEICDSGIDEDCDGDIDCDDSECAADPACDAGSCGERGDSCTDGAECCSGRCTSGGRCTG